MDRSVAIMQPYIFPYLGYFQLIDAVDIFVFYDDVNFIKKGWINRNRLFVNDSEFLFTVPLKKASQNKLIKDIALFDEEVWKKDFLITLKHAYSQAPYYDQVLDIVNRVFKKPLTNIGELAAQSIIEVVDYLEIEVEFQFSSKQHAKIQTDLAADRLIEITKHCQATTYVNASGGKNLYQKDYFQEHDIQLLFVSSNLEESLLKYDKSRYGLSILDVLMNHSKQEALVLIKQNNLI